MDDVLLAVNGGLMRDMRANDVLVSAGARFVDTANTVDQYRMWSIDDRFPAMVQSADGVAIAVELWAMSSDGFVDVLMSEPTGLCVGKVELDDGRLVLGVVGEPALCEGHREITEFGGWRAYCETLK